MAAPLGERFISIKFWGNERQIFFKKKCRNQLRRYSLTFTSCNVSSSKNTGISCNLLTAVLTLQPILDHYTDSNSVFASNLVTASDIFSQRIFSQFGLNMLRIGYNLLHVLSPAAQLGSKFNKCEPSKYPRSAPAPPQQHHSSSHTQWRRRNNVCSSVIIWAQEEKAHSTDTK